ncbi:hypothetical protein [Pseudoduganella sp. R-43]|uniref:hypothetical protein n=1 Tax=unclassified Pseudoduganella TaxID=2637179 RepID=UPI003CEB634F
MDAIECRLERTNGKISQWSSSMGCGVMEAIATKVEAITDDDDDLSSLCIWFDRGGYIALAREMGDRDIECEFLDQMNGFKPKRLEYELEKRVLQLTVFDDEYFDRERTLQQLKVNLPEGLFKLDHVIECLESIFAGCAL